ncbi:MAG: 23S rRNA (pseudouridine(1915)-N(3))-methyltransferase RlmH [Bdellovibrionota bacterium]
MKIVFLNVQTSHDKWSDLACETYIEKLKHFHKIEIKTLKPGKHARDKSDLKKEQDSELILQELSKDDFVILFDEKGRRLASLEYSQQIQLALNSGKKRMVFIIGGAFGVSAEVIMKANLTVNLSPMTMNHVVAQVVALEQTYRAFTILNKLPYHNA